MDFERLEEILNLREMKQVDLSRMLDIPQSTISGWKPLKHLNLDNIIKICRALDMPLYEFFMSENDKKDYFKIDPLLLGMCRRIEKLEKEKQLKFIKHIETGLDLISE